MKVLSFCLYGNKPMYDHGAIQNAKLAHDFFPDYECRFYVTKNYNYNIIRQLEKAGAVVIEESKLSSHLCTLWRLLPCFEYEVDYVVCRDVDARLTARDYNIVEQFYNSNDGVIQSLKDHELHNFPPLLAGMISIKTKQMYDTFNEDYIDFVLRGWNDYLDSYTVYGGNLKGCDQAFLNHIVFAKMHQQIKYYSDLTVNKIGPLDNRHYFIGAQFDENEKPLHIRGY